MRDPLSGLSARRRDALLAAGTAVLTLGGLLLTLPLLAEEGLAPLDPTRRALLLVLATAQALPLVWWRTRPRATLVAVVAVQVAVVVMLQDSEVTYRGIPTILVIARIGAVAAVRRGLALVLAAVAAEVLVRGVVLAGLGRPVLGPMLESMLSAGGTYLLAFLVGVIIAGRAENQRLQRQQERREQDVRLEAALAEERRRIAGELHDVAAHHLSGMVVQAAAVERLVDRDPEAAKAGAASLRRQGKETLDGLRSVVGLLRTGGPVAPVAGLRDLPQLARDARDLGVRVQLEVRGEVPELAPLVDAALYRIAQQSLSNALQHAPGAPVHLELDARGPMLALRVENPLAPATAPERPGAADGPGGTGLAVMRERAAAIGARLEAGPAEGGIWRILLQLQLPRPAAEAASGRPSADASGGPSAGDGGAR